MKNKNFFFKLYTLFIISLTLLAVFSFAVAEILEVIKSSSKFETIISVTRSIVEIIGSILAICCATHIVVMFLQSTLFKSEHSFIYILLNQAMPLVFPFISFVFIRSIWGPAIIDIMELLCGILAGLVSSILVLIMDKRHSLVKDVLKFIAPDFSEIK